MKGIAQIFALVAATVILGVSAAPKPASAISADLAKKCRDLAFKSHPYKLPGEKGPGSAVAERAYFTECVAKNGDMPSAPPKEDNAPKAPAGAGQIENDRAPAAPLPK
jgi:hypothetical protein